MSSVCISRRSFLRRASGFAVVASVAPSMAPSLLETLWAGIVGLFRRTTLSKLSKEQIIAEALGTKAGRISLAKAMVEPIRRNLGYQAVGRKLLMVDDIPHVMLARYEHDTASIAHIIARRGDGSGQKAGKVFWSSSIREAADEINQLLMAA